MLKYKIMELLELGGTSEDDPAQPLTKAGSPGASDTEAEFFMKTTEKMEMEVGPL